MHSVSASLNRTVLEKCNQNMIQLVDILYIFNTNFYIGFLNHFAILILEFRWGIVREWGSSGKKQNQRKDGEKEDDEIEGIIVYGSLLSKWVLLIRFFANNDPRFDKT